MEAEFFIAPSNPFRVKTAESYNQPRTIIALFAYPPNYELCSSANNNHIIIGSRGCGKTILLKQLAIPVQSLQQNFTKLNFCGVYIPRLLQLSTLLQIYRRDPDSVNKFEHYFTMKVVYEIASQFARASIPPKIKQEVSDIITTYLGLGNIESDRLASYLEEKIEKLELHFSCDPASNVVDPSGFKIQNLGMLRALLKYLSGKIHPLPSKIGLLIDDFQDYEELGILILNNLVSHKFLDFLCVKLGTRKIAVEPTDLSIEPFRDFIILSLDSNPNTSYWLDFLRRTSNNKLKQEWSLSDDDLRRINIDTLFPSIKPKGIQWDDQKMVGENLERIPDRDLRQQCFTGFEALAKVSMLNPFEFFEVCDKAFEIEKNKMGLVTIPPGISLHSQATALLEKARNYVDIEIPSRREYSGFFFGIRSLIVNLARYLQGKQDPPLFEGARLALPENLPLEYKNLFKSAIIQRDMFIPEEQLVSILLSTSPVIEEVEINRKICPRYGISWEYIGKYQIEEKVIEECYKKPYREPIGKRKRESKNLPLFEIEKQGKWVFEARPYRYDNPKIQRAVYSLRKEEEESFGRVLLGEQVWYMNEEIASRHLPPVSFPDYLEEAIKNSLYLVATITPEPKTGVAYEIGIALAYKIPIFLFWDSVRLGRGFKEEDKKSWHPFIRKFHVREWRPKDVRKGFKNWYKENIDDVGKKVFKHIKCPLRIIEQEGCPFEAFTKKGINKPYILFQSQNRKAEELVIDFLSRYNCYPIQSSDLPKEADDICAKCISIRASIFQIIDGSAPGKGMKGDPACALELGFAHAIHKQNTLMLYNADISLEPVTMFHGALHGWHESTIQKDLEEELREFMDKFPEFGGIKK